MSSSAYEIAALAMRFWFAALTVYLLFRTVSAVLRDYGNQRRLRKAEISSIGVLEVVEPSKDAKGRPHPLYGRRYPLRKENRIGSARSSDIRIKAKGIEPSQASIYQKGNRIMLADFGGRRGVYLNGVRVGKEEKALVSGDEIIIANVVLVLHLFGAAEQAQRAPQPGVQFAAETPGESAGLEDFCDQLFEEEEKKKKRRRRR